MISFLRPALKYGSIGGVLIVAFAYLKSGWFLSGLYPDLYITLIATVFVGIGFFVGAKLWSNRSEEARATEEATPALFALLSKRELKVLEQLETDLSNKEIAGVLCIELSTLKTHINSIYKKLEVKNRVELRLKLGKLDYSNLLIA
jgi:DNA-binding NarL/FixJ family response regulator